MTAHTIERIVFLYFRENLTYEKIAYVVDVPVDLVQEAIRVEIQACIAAESPVFAPYTPKGAENQSINKSSNIPA